MFVFKTEFSVEFTGIYCLHRAMVCKLMETLTMVKFKYKYPVWSEFDCYCKQLIKDCQMKIKVYGLFFLVIFLASIKAYITGCLVVFFLIALRAPFFNIIVIWCLMFKIFAIHEYINQSIDFAAKFSYTKNGFPKEVSHH